MKKLLTWLGFLLLTACASVPVTQRKQLRLVDTYTIHKESELAYTEFIAQNATLSPYTAAYKQVNRIGNKLVDGCLGYLRTQNNQMYLSQYDWEFNVVDDPQINAFCMPGGKVVVNTGLLQAFPSDEELAVVMSHEIAHAVANHSTEQISQQVLLGGAQAMVQSILDMNYDHSLSSITLNETISNLFGLGVNASMLKFSRTHETEADKMGLVFMEFAGYDSENAIGFWEKMGTLSTQEGPDFFQTHPSSDQRIQAIKEYIPVAKSYQTP